MPQVYRSGKAWQYWVLTAVLVVWVLLLWYSEPATGWGRFYLLAKLVVLLALLVVYGDRLRGDLRLLAGGVLVSQAEFRLRHLPLAGDVRATREGVAIRWEEGGRGRLQTVRMPPALVEATLAMAQEAREADPTAAARTQEEAARAVVVSPLTGPLGIGQMRLVAGIAALVGLLAAWSLQPLWLLPVPAVVLVALLTASDQYLVLCGDSLWLVKPDQEPRRFTLSQVRLVARAGLGGVRIDLADPHCPALVVQRHYGGADMLSALNRCTATTV